jgi:hypothetical protein
MNEVRVVQRKIIAHTSCYDGVTSRILYLQVPYVSFFSFFCYVLLNRTMIEWMKSVEFCWYGLLLFFDTRERE